MKKSKMLTICSYFCDWFDKMTCYYIVDIRGEQKLPKPNQNILYFSLSRKTPMQKASAFFFFAESPMQKASAFFFFAELPMQKASEN